MRAIAGACAIACALFAATTAIAQSNEEEGLDARRARVHTKSAVEHVINVPGLVLQIPFRALGLTLKYSMIGVDKTRLPERVKAIFREPLSPVVSYGSRPGFAGGLRLKLRDVGADDSDLTAHGTYSTNSHQDYYLRYRARDIAGRFYMSARAGYNVNTNEDFYLTNAADTGARSNFEHELIEARFAGGGQLTDRIGAELRVEASDHAFADGDGLYESTVDVVGEAGAPGIGGVTLAGVGAAVTYDSRDNDYYASRGVRVALSAMTFAELSSEQAAGEEFTFTRYGLDASTYVTLGRPGRILAARLAAEMTTDAGDRKTPFFALSDLGGAEDLRSYDTGRFRDKDSILLNVEYRYPIWEAVLGLKAGADAVLFADIGRVFPDLFTDTFKDYNVVYGFGLRARMTDGFVGRAEMAFGDEETRIIFQFDPIF